MARQVAASDSVLEESNFSKGIIRDTPRTLIPNGGVYDASDFLLHQPGVAIKRGGTSYAGPALAGLGSIYSLATSDKARKMPGTYATLAGAGIGGAVLAGGLANAWNPVGWALLGAGALSNLFGWEL